ncbi:hypothetical protein AVEN_88712-1 [Araneus ventricosus]|uniref:ISXO2-like transposase domain-containing protein n=1 Tax=Araneus ventricosus TaxID=182803 RepID=A0A4Y2Q6W9_ARAVE|nr:hypothetical protein AVEN_88712-1 [Araneus ventricosus]
MSMNVQEWMSGEWDGQKYYSPAEWMKGEWNIFFFYELMKLGENACLKFCMDNGLLAKWYECPVCGERMKLVDSDGTKVGKVWSCRKRGVNAHQIKRAVRKGSWFQDSHLSLGVILCLTYMWVNRMTKESIMNDLDLASQTVTDWMNFCREVCEDECLAFDGRIGGVGKIVEIDESKFGKRKYNRGRRVEGKWVFGGLLRYSNECFFEVVDERSADVLLEVIKRRILPGTTIMSDCWSSYSCLSDEGFKHLTVNHSVTFVDPDTEAHTNAIEGTWSALKRSLHGTNHVAGEFDAYMAEYIWRRQNNYRITEKVQRFFGAISRAFPPPNKD